MNLWVVNDKYENLAIVDSYTSAIWVERYNTAGEFELKIPLSRASNFISYMVPGNYIVYTESDTYMIIETSEIKTENGIGYNYVAGRDLKSILDRRVVIDWQWFDEALLWESVRTLLNDNIISPTDSARKIPGFSFVTPTDSDILAATIDQQVLGEDLLTLISEWCADYSFGFDVRPNGAGGFKFIFYKGVNRAYSQEVNPWVIFSTQFENLASSRYYISETEHKTVGILGGEGEGAEKTIVEITDSEGGGSGLDRKEAYFEISISRATDEEDEEGNPIELTDEEYLRLLVFEGAAQLSKKKTEEVFDGEVDATRQFIYGRDFTIGDIVQIVNEWGLESEARITEVAISDDDSDGFKMIPTFSSIEGDET